MALPVRAMLVKSLGFASISGTYANVGSKIDNSLRIIWIQNLTDETLMFSFDAVNDHFPLVANAFVLLDLNSNQLQNQTGLFLGIGTQLFVRQLSAGPTSGAVYFSGFYGRGE